MAKQIKNPYNLRIGTVYRLDNSGFYIIHGIDKALSGVFLYFLTYTSNDGKTTNRDIWHQYNEFSKLSKLKETEKTLQVLYGSDKGSL